MEKKVRDRFKCGNCGWIGTQTEMFNEQDIDYNQDSCKNCKEVMIDNRFDRIYCEVVHPIKGVQDSLIKETKAEMQDQGVTAYQIGKLGLISAQTVGNIEVNEGLKVFTALAILSSLGKTLQIVDMPNEMKKAVNTWHQTNKNKK